MPVWRAVNHAPGNDGRQLELAIAAQEGLRGVVPDAVVDAAIEALRRQLSESTGESQRRRQVSVLFADVSGFTAMSSRLDPEVVAQTMNELWSVLDAVVVEHGGRIDKHIGDAVMAIWGATSTKEDDPEKAVRAGLAMQEALRASSSGEGLAMRIGINTGPVHLGAVGAGMEFTAMGDTVNVASRVEGLAAPGDVLVTHETYRHIRGVFDVEALEPAAIKGKDQPIHAYVVRRPKTRAFRLPTRGVEGVETKMIGRIEELGILRAEFERIVETPTARRITVVGEAGIGKSRLLYEFENWIELHPVTAYFFKGRAMPTRRSAAFGLVRDLLGDRYGITDNDSTATVADKLHVALSPPLTEGEADLVGHWLGFDLSSTEAVRRLLGHGHLAAAARAHLFHYLEALAAVDPVVIFLEDLHWADEESLALIDELVAELADVHLLIVGVGRPALLERVDAADLLERSTTALRLEPLGAPATSALVSEVLQKVEAVPDQLIDLIVERADGNSFYVEELVKMLIDDGVIETGEAWDAWTINLERLDPNRVPATLTGVLQARLDSLGRPEREVLQRSSVVGRVFWDGLVSLLGGEGIETTVRSLELTRQRELVFRRERSSFAESMEYSFKHALLRDVTYETVLLRDRHRLHGIVARWISEHAGDREIEYAGLIATHYRLGGDPSAAAEHLSRAGIGALASGNASSAHRLLQEAFELWRESGEQPSPASLTALAESCLRRGDIETAHRYDEEALIRAETPAQRAAALHLAGWIAAERGDRDRERTVLLEALPEAERQGGMLLTRVLHGLAWSAVEQGDLADAASLAERARELAEQLHSIVATREASGLLSVLAGMSGDLHGALRHGDDALAAALEAGDVEGEALARCNMGVAHHLIGDAEESRDAYLAALEHYERAEALHERLGRHLIDGMLSANIAQVHTRLGNDPAARRHLRDAIETTRRSGGFTTLMFCLLAEADRRLMTGKTEQGLHLIGLVRQHPARSKDNENEIDRILNRVSLSPQQVENSWQNHSTAEDLDAVLDRVVEELAADVDDSDHNS